MSEIGKTFRRRKFIYLPQLKMFLIHFVVKVQSIKNFKRKKEEIRNKKKGQGIRP